MAKTYAFRLYAGGELDAVRVKLELMLSAWATEWFPLLRASDVCIADLGSCDGKMPYDKGWVIYGKGELTHTVVNRRSDALKGIANALAGEAAKDQPARLPLSPVLAAVVDQALIDLVATITGTAVPGDAIDIEVTLDVQDHLRHATAPGSGALSCTFNLGDCALGVILDTELSSRFVPSRAPVAKGRKKLTPLLTAVSRRQIRANLVLGNAELSVAEFVGLAAGDVILLDHKIGQPFDLCTSTGKFLSGVQIGTQGSQIAAAIVGKS